ncbi:conserved hypothetical protein [Ricinus communis]|uniref:Prepilin-type N-terminal cleavage/methylation domain-containing protein n=1 Tax=Ricinus communis TaxID=3988 RepID=B9TFC7_RICCO|nr:conserved hypothetical protein [Ricinus communis]
MSGFSLLEMALALVILSLMMGWLMTPLRVQQALQKYQQTEQRLYAAQQALLGHAIIYHYLPCPDTDQPPDGWENVSANQSCVGDERCAAMATTRPGGDRCLGTFFALPC